jgi:hypothetical protein
VALREAQNAVDRREPLRADIDLMAQVAMERFAKNDVFMRFKEPGKLWWEYQVGSPDVTNGMVYDWRGGFPALMMYASLRATIMLAREPDMRQTSTFDRELAAIRANMWTHIQRMLQGVRCGNKMDNNLKHIPERDLRPVVVSGGSDLFYVTCADVHTGHAYQEIAKGSRSDPAFEKGVDRIYDQMKTKLGEAMPLHAWANLNAQLHAMEEGS